MPHLSPIQWSTMLISMWVMLTMIVINTHPMNNKSMTTNKKKKTQPNHKWKWY